MSKQNNRSQWSASRFIKTLADFDVIPVLSWLQRLTKNHKNSFSGETKLKSVLVGGVTNYVGKVGQKLVEHGYQVHQPTRSPSGKLFFPDIEAVIYCSFKDTLKEEFTNLIKAATEYFKTIANDEKIIFNFKNPNNNLKNIWGAVDDVVMGGISESEIRFVDNIAVFTGNVSTANSGGFASIRTKNFEQKLNLVGYQGIRLQVKGDGNRYKFFIRTESKWDGIAYSYSFDTISDTWINVDIPFTDLIPVFRAKTLTDAPKIDLSNIFSFQLMLSKFEYDKELNPNFSPGNFALQVESIKAYGGTIPRFILLSSLPTIYEDEVRQSGITYTVIRFGTVTEEPGVKPLIFAQGDRLNAKVNLDSIAELCTQVLAHPQACNVTFDIKEDSSQAMNWENLFNSLQPDK